MSFSDLVVIVTGKLSRKSKDTLRKDGWIVKTLDTIANPGKTFPKRFSAVYTKLGIFNLTEYKKGHFMVTLSAVMCEICVIVVYMDADTIALKNVDVLFTCPGFCAALRHSERLNSGVMVVTPSTSLYSDMISKIDTYPSYTGSSLVHTFSHINGDALQRRSRIFECLSGEFCERAAVRSGKGGAQRHSGLPWRGNDVRV